MAASILIGAGAEVSAPYKIPGGQDFTWETCYTYNNALHKALGEYYSTILESPNRDTRLPRKYQSTFLYEASSTSFRELINGVLNSDEGIDIIADFIGMDFIERKQAGESNPKLSPEELETLYDDLIKETDTDSKDVQELKDCLFKDLPDDAYYGTIERYFSSLLNPSRRNKSFWKLINYYWSAFFAVAAPLIVREFIKDAQFQKKGLYQFTLNNLPEVLHTITSNEYIDRLSDEKQNYYSQLSGLFDYALTTNYTPFIRSMRIKDNSGPIRLSGSITLFESVPDLCVYDLLKDDVPENTFLFPFVMTQVPVKPIIDFCQMREYSRAVNALDRSDAVVILGYSLCQNDAHIGSLLQAYLRRRSSNRLIYLDYQSTGTSSAIQVEDILDRIRISTDYQEQINVIPFGEDGGVSVDELRPCIETILNADTSGDESKETS